MKKTALTTAIFTLVLLIHISSFAQNTWQEREKVKSLPVKETNRPLRTMHPMTLTVGQTEGDLIGKDDKIIQAGIEYLNRTWRRNTEYSSRCLHHEEFDLSSSEYHDKGLG